MSVAMPHTAYAAPVESNSGNLAARKMRVPSPKSPASSNSMARFSCSTRRSLWRKRVAMSGGNTSSSVWPRIRRDVAPGEALEHAVDEQVAALRVLGEHHGARVVEHLLQARLAVLQRALGAVEWRQSSFMVRGPGGDSGPSIGTRNRRPLDCYTAETKPPRARAALSGSRHEHVADAAHGADHLRVLGVGLDLAAQARDADVDRAVVRVPLAVAREREDAVARQRLAGMLGEDLEQVELHGRDRDLLPGAVEQLVRGEVEPAAAEAHALRRAAAAFGLAAGRACVRRSTLFTRASSSRGSKGLVT